MATAAVRAELAIVIVIGAMTAAAAVSRSLHRYQRTAMTVIAGNIDVCAVNGEAGLSVVVKQPQVPGNRVVTGLTVFFELSIV
jgi:hypothetical protein